MKTYITTNSGKTIDYLNPDPKQITIEDIAHGLSQECRWGAQTKVFYSVAAHSIMVSMVCAETSMLHALKGLLHDASEAFLRDLPTPLKELPELAGYKIIEARMMKAIGEALDVDLIDLPPEIHAADRKIALMEDAYLMNPPHVEENEFLNEDGTSKVKWAVLPPAACEDAFLKVYANLREHLQPRIIIP